VANIFTTQCEESLILTHPLHCSYVCCGPSPLVQQLQRLQS